MIQMIVFLMGLCFGFSLGIWFFDWWQTRRDEERLREWRLAERQRLVEWFSEN
jgi:hypothetical protein